LAERRSVVEQFPVSAGTSCSFVAPVVEHFATATVKSLSMEAVRLVLTRQVEPGALLAVSLCNPAKRFEKLMLVRVSQTAHAPGGCLVGGTFVTPLTYQELTTLVM
jgi:hypothetical protein